MYYSLDKYPIDEILSKIARIETRYRDQLTSIYMYKRKSHLKDETAWPIELCLNDFIAPFQHLTADENYDIFCYVAHEFHGSVGSVAAIQHGESHSAKCESLAPFPDIILPEASVDPMEVIYCDGTPEGYLEAALCEKMLQGFPLILNIYSDYNSILFDRPKSLDQTWDMLLHVDNWCPQVKGSSLYFYMFEFEHGMEASNGRSRISLRCYSFSDQLDLRRAFGMSSTYPKQLPSKNRYQGKHFCVSHKTSINIAEERNRR